MNVPELHSEKLSDMAYDISSIDHHDVRMIRRLNAAVDKSAKQAYKEIAGIIKLKRAKGL